MRRPLEERCDKGALGFVGGVPWPVNDDDRKADGEAMKMDIPSGAKRATRRWWVQRRQQNGRRFR